MTDPTLEDLKAAMEAARTAYAAADDEAEMDAAFDDYLTARDAYHDALKAQDKTDD